jgi:hypothetical protein
MKSTDNPIFKYPTNVQELDLATLVSMYRKRGEPVEAPAGEYFGCALTHRLIRKAKWWFGLYYSQEAWDELLTENAKGYPLTPVEFKILGLAKIHFQDPQVDRSYIEEQSGTIPQFAFMISNDLKQFGLMEGEGKQELRITSAGRKALDGLSNRLYARPFSPELLDPEGTASKEKPEIAAKAPTGQSRSSANSSSELKPAPKKQSEAQQASLF